MCELGWVRLRLGLHEPETSKDRFGGVQGAVSVMIVHQASRLWEKLRDPGRPVPTLTIMSMVMRIDAAAEAGILTAVRAALILRRTL